MRGTFGFIAGIVAAAVAGFGAERAAAQAPGFYGRIDTGYAWSENAKLRDNVPFFLCGPPGCSTPGQLNDVGSSWILGGGAGYRFNSLLRTDITASYRGGFKLNAVDTLPSYYSASMSSWNLMLNGYVDIPAPIMPSWFKPYVGAGVGYARNTMNTIANYAQPVGLATWIIPGGSHGGFAWQASLGAGIDVGNGMIVDVGYRYMDSGKLETAAANIIFVPAAFAFPYAGMNGKLRTNELQIGLRF